MYIISRLRQDPLRLLQRNSFWIALALHLLVLASASIIWVLPQNKEKSPGLYIPSYVYQEPIQPQVAKSEPVKSAPQRKGGYEEPQSSTAEPHPKQNGSNQVQVMNISKSTEPVHLIGDKTIAAPLLTLIGKALTRQLTYPKIAVDFNIRGTPLIGFLLNPDGTVSDAQLVRSSGAGVLDDEAIRAVYSTSPIAHVDQYLQESKYLVVGIIFG